MRAATRPDWRVAGVWLALFVVALVVYFVGLGRPPITDAESKYAEAPREMLALGDWLTPHDDYIRDLSKPPLVFWITAAGYRVFGVTPLVARAPGIIAGLAVGLLIGAFGTHFFGRRVGWLAAFTWLTTSLVYVFSREVGLEFWLVLFMGMALLGFARGLDERRWLYLAYVSMALGVLVKGPMGVLWPLGSALLWLSFTGRRRQWRRLWHPRAFLLFLALALPWPLAMTVRHDDFLWYAIVHEQIYRVLGKRTPNEGLFPTSTFLLLTVAQFFPWILNLPQALAAAARRLRASREPGLVLALVWAGLPLVFFSLARSKGDYYALEVYPGLCVLVAWLWNEVLEGRARRLWLAAPWLGVGALALGIFVVERLHIASLPPSPGDIAERLVPATALAGLAVGAAVGAGRGRLALIGIAVYMTIFFAAFSDMFGSRARNESMSFAALVYRAEAPPGARLVSDERPEFGHVCVLPFYTGQPAWLVRDPKDSKLHFSYKEFEKRVIDEPDLVRWVRSGTPVYVVGELDRWPRRFARLGLHGILRARQGERGLFRVEPGEHP